jgi:hypothetical protein
VLNVRKANFQTETASAKLVKNRPIVLVEVKSLLAPVHLTARAPLVKKGALSPKMEAFVVSVRKI